VEVLITNMMDCEAYEVDLFKELYYLRWGIEENYKRLKQWVEIENFSGASFLTKLGLNLLGNLTLNHEFFYPLFFVRLFPSKRLNLRIEALRVGRSAPRSLKSFKNDIHFSAYKSSL
jgi:hypothetical protein